MDVFSHHSTILCNSYFMGSIYKTRIDLYSQVKYSKLETCPVKLSGGSNDSNDSRRITHLRGGRTKAQGVEVHDQEVYRHWQTRRCQSRYTVARKNISHRPIHRAQRQARKQQIKLKAANSWRRLKSFEAVHKSSPVVQTLDDLLDLAASFNSLPYVTRICNPCVTYGDVLGGGWR